MIKIMIPPRWRASLAGALQNFVLVPFDELPSGR